MNPKLKELCSILESSALINDWSSYTDIVKEKFEQRFFTELVEVCNNTHEQLHGKSDKAAKEILGKKTGYLDIFNLQKGITL